MRMCVPKGRSGLTTGSLSTDVFPDGPVPDSETTPEIFLVATDLHDIPGAQGHQTSRNGGRHFLGKDGPFRVGVLARRADVYNRFGHGPILRFNCYRVVVFPTFSFPLLASILPIPLW